MQTGRYSKPVYRDHSWNQGKGFYTQVVSLYRSYAQAIMSVSLIIYIFMRVTADIVVI